MHLLGTKLYFFKSRRNSLVPNFGYSVTIKIKVPIFDQHQSRYIVDHYVVNVIIQLTINVVIILLMINVKAVILLLIEA
jgi:hypothetical protein